MESFFVKSSTPLVLYIIPIASPLVALSNDSFWWFMGVTFVINGLLILRAGKMTNIISPGNPGSIVLMIPILATIFGYPVIAIIHWLL